MLQKSLDEVVAEHRQREATVAEKCVRYARKRERMNRKLAISGALLSLLMSLFLLYLSDAFFLVILMPLGGLAGYLIGKWNVGIIQGMIIFAASQGIAFRICTYLSIANLGEAATSNDVYGGIIVLFAIAGYSVIGSVLGLANYWFDRDHLQV